MEMMGGLAAIAQKDHKVFVYFLYRASSIQFSEDYGGETVVSPSIEQSGLAQPIEVLHTTKLVEPAGSR